MKTSREKVFDYIRYHSNASASDISSALRMTQANARHHISILLSQGLLEPAGERQPSGKGRPVQTFRESQQVLGDNLPPLVHATLTLVRQQLGEENYLRSLRTLASSIGGLDNQSYTEPSQTLPLSQRLVTAITNLNRKNYQARWEAHRNGPLIRFGRCPYLKIIHLHPELCQMDRYLLEIITASAVNQTACLAKDPSGSTYCLFQISNKPAQKAQEREKLSE